MKNQQGVGELEKKNINRRKKLQWQNFKQKTKI